MKEILRQASWLFFAQVLTRFIGFFYTIFLANKLGVLDFGLLTVGFAYFSILSSVSDFGFNRYLIRELARGEMKSADLVSNIVMLRLTITAILFAIFSLILYYFDPDKFRVSIILLSTLAILPQSVALTFDGIFVALRKLQLSSLALIISSMSTVLAGFLLVTAGFGVTGAVNALIFGQLMYVLALVLLIHTNRTSILSQVNFSMIKKIIVGSLPYGLLAILGLLYFRVDTIMLSYLKGSFETGIYGVSYRFLEAITFIPTVFFSSLFPVLANTHTANPTQVKTLYFKSLKLLSGLGFLILIVYIFILPEVIKVFLPNYLSSIQAITILSLSIPFMMMQTSSISVLLSTDKFLKQILFLSLGTLIFNIVANLIFIPQYGYLAAAWVTVLSEVLSFIIFFQFTKNKILNR